MTYHYEFKCLGKGASFVTSEAEAKKLPISEKDVRSDPLAKCAVSAVKEAFNDTSIHSFQDQCAVLAVTSTGCEIHLGKVIEGVGEGKMRPSSFIRSGFQILSSYISMTFGLHGPALTYVRDSSENPTDQFPEIFQTAGHLLQFGLAQTVVLVFADWKEESKGATAWHLALKTIEDGTQITFSFPESIS